MFRTTVLRAIATARAAAPTAVRPAALRTPAWQAPAAAARPLGAQGVRFYSAPASLNKKEVEGRIVDLLKSFDKVTAETKVTGTSHFTNDLGLDSLDTVEVVMAIEEEFSIEIPDKDADNIHSVDQAVSYIVGQPDAH